MRRPRLWMVLAAAVLSSLIVTIARPALADPLDIIVGGVWVFKITQGTDGMAPEQRVVDVHRQITEVLSKYRAGDNLPINLKPFGRNVAITVGDIRVVMVTSADAQGTGVTTMELARQWANRLVQGLVRALPDPTFHVF